ncbi:MAG TPA: ABC transporter ATP-binding protein [Amycolatopsis sp.]|nr:ABC transporter ATP-binding protein [Amycolatopsis sp.]
MNPLLQVEQLCVDYPAKRRQSFRAVDSVDLTVAPGETLGLVGESGSGKSTIAKAILGIAPVTSGTIRFDGAELDTRRVRRRKPVTDLGVVFQDPVSSLDPTKTVGYTVAEPLVAKLRREGGEKPDVRQRVAEMLDRVGLPAGAASRYPAQFSGGQRQRIAIARAFIVEPRLVICDEAVSALDLSVQAQILNLLTDVQRELAVSYLFISHDLSVVEHLSDRVLVLYRGRVMESGTAAGLVQSPRHPYTRALLAAAPVHDPARQRERRELRASYRVERGRSVSLGNSCPYTHRCRFAVDQCFQQRPLPQAIDAGGVVACHRYGDLPPDATIDLAAGPGPAATEGAQ